MRIKLNLFFILFLFLCYYIGFLEQAVIIFISVFLHELGHVWAAKLLKIRVEEVELFPFGGVARMEDISKYGGLTEAIVALAGPMISLQLAMLFYILSIFGNIFRICMEYNFLLFVFNLIPVLPMDGGRIVRNILLHYTSYKNATRIMTLLGRLFAILLVVYNAVMILNGGKSVSQLIIAVFVFLGAEKEMKFCSYYYLLSRNNKKIKQIRRNTIRKRIINVHEDTYIRFAANHFSPSSLCEIRVINRQGKTIRVFNEADIMDGMIKYGFDGKIEEMLK